MSDREFGLLNDRQFWKLVERHELQEQRADFRAGVIASLLFNCNRDPEKSKPLFAHDFFPSLPKPKAQRQRRQSPEAIFRALMFGQSAKAEQFLQEVKAFRNGKGKAPDSASQS